ncbi:MAG: 3-deoxy-D-manno-octulosonic acid transferase [Bacteroidales bacterium]|nr:3-deoxy-D-manno-octulosonic acid transferase [Bacteroidales bacterium]
MSFLYNIAIGGYGAAINVAGAFNNKARLFKEGRKGLLERMASEVDHSHPIIWFHCSSVGEFEQARPLIEWYKENCSEYRILLTFFSPSGYEMRKNYPLADWIYYMPLDTVSNACRFLDIAKPQKAIFIKYEFWYNFLTQLHKRGISTYIVSAIFREDQPFFKPYGGLFRRMLKSFTALFVQDMQSAQLLESIGLKENVTVCGDTRFDRVNQITAASKEFPAIEIFSRNAFTVLAGSTWGPDEEILAASVKNFSKAKLVIAPHEIHKEHIDKICTQFKGYRIIKFSEFNEKFMAAYNAGGEELAKYEQELQQANVLLIDCLGILSSIYRYGKFAYIGGGFGVGIHNILEAATYGIPVVFGPNYRKFKEARDLIARQGATSVRSQEEFYGLLDNFIKSETIRKERGKVCLNYVKENLGATEKIIGKIENISF